MLWGILFLPLQVLSLGRQVCLDYSCTDSALVPCIATEICQPVNVACNNTCPEGMSVCPTTNLCHVSSLSESCDNSNVTCLIGQSLVQRSDATRYCTATGSLPAGAATCSNNDVYCEDLDACMDLSTPYLCQPCPGQLLLCPNTNECVSDIAQCCESSEDFCAVLNSCIRAGARCALPNLAPEVTSDLIHLDSLQTFDEENIDSNGGGYMISMLLGNQSLDSQGDELGVAIVGVSAVPVSQGEWQFALNSSRSWMSVPRSMVSESNALLLSRSAYLRFVRRSEALSGAVWLRVKLWDGNDGFLSQDNVAPSYSSTIPFTLNGPFSERTILLTVLAHPLISLPSFIPLATHQFDRIQEDVLFFQNLGNSLSEVVLSVDITNLPVLPENSIEGFPESAGTGFEQLLPAEVRDRYYDDVRRVNPTLIERLQALQAGQSPGVAITLDPAAPNQSGTWQVALMNDPKQFRSLEAVLSTENSGFVLLNVSARLRYLPVPSFCGVTSVLLTPWDGFWNTSVAVQLESGYIVSSSAGPSLSQYNLNSWARAELEVACTEDRPQVLETNVQLSPIPYRIAYRYERLFTLLVGRETTSLRADQQLLSNYLQIILQQPVTVHRLSPALQGR